MLVKEGHKGSYILGGVIQIILFILLAFLLIPYMLSYVGIEISGWKDIVDKIHDLAIGKYVFGAIHFILPILFILQVLSLLFRRSGASFFVKMSGAAAMFPFACLGLENGISYVSGKNVDIMQIFEGGLNYILIVGSIILLILGFVFQVTVSRDNEHKANVFLFAKSIIWIALLLFNFIIPSILTSSNWLNALLGYNATAVFPYFLCWMFFVLGILQFASSPELINPEDSNFSSGTPYQPYQQPVQPIPVAYIPVQPVMAGFTPVYPTNTALQGKGKRQGLESSDEAENSLDTIKTQEVQKPEQKVTLEKEQKAGLTPETQPKTEEKEKLEENKDSKLSQPTQKVEEKKTDQKAEEKPEEKKENKEDKKEGKPNEKVEEKQKSTVKKVTKKPEQKEEKPVETKPEEKGETKSENKTETQNKETLKNDQKDKKEDGQK